MPVRGQARAVDKVRVVHAELFGTLVHARDKRFLLPAKCSPSATAASLPETTHTALMSLRRASARPLDARSAAAHRCGVRAACDGVVIRKCAGVDGLHREQQRHHLRHARGSRGVCSSLAKSTVPVCFSIKRAEGASSVSSSARTARTKAARTAGSSGTFVSWRSSFLRLAKNMKGFAPT